MKKLCAAALLSLIGFSANAQTTVKKAVPAKKPVTTGIKKPLVTAKPVAQTPVFKNNLDSASYAFGFSMASQLKSGGLKTLNYDFLVAALKDVFEDKETLLDQGKAQAAITKLFESFSKERDEAEKAKYLPTINEGNAFLAQNKNKPGIKVTASGLQYEVITEGAGAKPVESDQVTVNYKGTLLNGTQFDSSYDRGEPTTFPLTRVISGWTEGLQLMSVGAKYRFFIPYDLGYGARANGQITPFSTLVFEIELIKIGN